MFSRVLGVLLLIRVVAPVIIVAATVVIIHEVYVDVEPSAARSARLIVKSVESLRDPLLQAESQLKAIEAEIQTGEAFSMLPTLDFEIPSQITVGPISVPSITVPVPAVSEGTKHVCLDTPIPKPDGGHYEACGDIPYPEISSTSETVPVPTIAAFSVPLPTPFAELGQFTEGLAPVVGAIQSTIGDIGQLNETIKEVRGPLDEIATQGESLAREMEAEAKALAWQFLFLFGGIGLLIAVSYAATSLDTLRAGWRLAAGKD